MGIEIDGKPIKNTLDGSEKLPLKSGDIGRHTLISKIKNYIFGGTTFSSNRVIKSSLGSVVEADAITADRALISDSNGIPTHSATTNTELGYVAGVTSSIQDQIDDVQTKDIVEIDETDFTAGIYTVAEADMNKYIIADLTASAADRTIKIQDATAANKRETIAINYKSGSILLTVTTVGGTQSIGDSTSQVFTKNDETVTLLDNATEYIIVQDSRISTSSVDLDREPAVGHIINLEKYIGHNGAAFIGEGGLVTDNGDGTVTISEAEAYIKTSNTIDSSFKAVVVASDTLTIAQDSNITIYIDYNAGDPVFKQRVASTGYFYANWDEIPFSTVVNTGSEIIVNDFCEATTNGGYKSTLSQINYQPFRYIGGLGTSETGTRNIAVAAGFVIFANDDLTIPAIDTSVSDTYTNIYYSGSAWIRTAAQTTISNTQYNDITLGMVNLSNNKFANKYLYFVKNSPSYWAVLEGQEQYSTLAEAQNAGFPASLPAELNPFYAGALPVAVLVVKEGQSAIQAILNPLETPFSSSVASSHQNLTDLLLAAAGVTYGHISNLAQSISGLKTFLDGIISSFLQVISLTPYVRLESTDTYDNIPNAEINPRFKYNIAGNVTDFGKIYFSKNNATDGDTGGYTAFYKKPNGAVTVEAFRIDPDGHIIFASGSEPSTGAATDSILVIDSSGEVKQVTLETLFTNPTFVGEIGIGSVNVSETELGILEGATVTTAILNELKPKTYQTLTSSASIAMNVDDGLNAKVTLGHNATLTLSNLDSGDEGNIIVTQDATGSRTLTISPTPYVINDGGGDITLTTTASAIDALSYTYDGSRLLINYGKNYTNS